MNRNRSVRRTVWLAVGVALALSIAWALRPQPILVTTAPVERGTLSATVTAEGRTQVKELYVVSTPVDGQLERVVVHPSDVVADGAVVAEVKPGASRPLDPRSRGEASAAVASAEAAVACATAAESEARVAEEHAESQLATTRQLAEKGAAPRVARAPRSRSRDAPPRRRPGRGGRAFGARRSRSGTRRPGSEPREARRDDRRPVTDRRPHPARAT